MLRLRQDVESNLGSVESELYNRAWPKDERLSQCRQEIRQINEFTGFSVDLIGIQSVRLPLKKRQLVGFLRVRKQFLTALDE